jgi:hypothetical protein
MCSAAQDRYWGLTCPILSSEPFSCTSCNWASGVQEVFFCYVGWTWQDDPGVLVHLSGTQEISWHLGCFPFRPGNCPVSLVFVVQLPLYTPHFYLLIPKLDTFWLVSSVPSDPVCFVVSVHHLFWSAATSAVLSNIDPYLTCFQVCTYF